MAKGISTLEKNTSASFGYVKKDVLMLNDSFSDLHDKFEKVLSSYDSILEEVKTLKKEVESLKGKKKVVVKKRV